jgi:hypothetical protein
MIFYQSASIAFDCGSYLYSFWQFHNSASIAQLGERKTEDLKVTGSIPVRGISFSFSRPLSVSFL